jgi:hypothetical protein
MNVFEKISARTIEEGDCLLWTGTMCAGRTIPSIFNKGKLASVCRLIWNKKNGSIPAGMLIYRTCGNIQCVRPAHLGMCTVSELARFSGLMGKHKKTELQKVAIALTMRKSAKLTQSDVDCILLSDEKPSELAVRFKVSERLIYSIRNGTRWKYRASNPWGGLI